MDSNSKINDSENQVPKNVIALLLHDESYRSTVEDIISPLKGNKKRDWFTPHFYYCLPLVIGNQYGFIIKSLYDWTAFWDGNNNPYTVKIQIADDNPKGHQFITNHFGSGIITIQNRFSIRTEPGVNLITINPPNYILPNLQNMTGVVETDNLRRDFTFNLKITTPDIPVTVKKGQPIAAFLPIPRYYVENFEIKIAEDIFSNDILQNEREMAQKFGKERSSVDLEKPHRAGRRYWNGEDADGIKFLDHQKKIK